MIQSHINSKSNNEFKVDGGGSNKNKNREEWQEALQQCHWLPTAAIDYWQQPLITGSINNIKKNSNNSDNSDNHENDNNANNNPGTTQTKAKKIRASAMMTTSNNWLMPQLYSKVGVTGDSKGYACSASRGGPLHVAIIKVVVAALWCRGTSSGNSFGCRRGDSNATTLPWCNTEK